MKFAAKTGFVLAAVLVGGAILIWYQRQNPATVTAKVQLPSLKDLLSSINAQYNAPAYGTTGTGASYA